MAAVGVIWTCGIEVGDCSELLLSLLSVLSQTGGHLDLYRLRCHGYLILLSVVFTIPLRAPAASTSGNSGIVLFITLPHYTAVERPKPRRGGLARFLHVAAAV